MGNLIQEPCHINANIHFFFTDGYYIDGKLFVPWDEVKNAIEKTKEDSNITVQDGVILCFDKEMKTHYCPNCGVINSIANKHCPYCGATVIGA